VNRFRQARTRTLTPRSWTAGRSTGTSRRTAAHILAGPAPQPFSSCSRDYAGGSVGRGDFGRVQVYRAAPVQSQAEPVISRPGDRYEQEADRIAEQVLRMPAAAFAPGQQAVTPACSLISAARLQMLQRQPLEEEEPYREPPEPIGLPAAVPEEEEEGQLVQAKELAGHEAEAAPAAGVLRAVVPASGAGGGRPLEAPLRGFMEQRFGVDFSQVRIYADGEAAQLTRLMHARAFTAGSRIYFGAGEYRPDSAAGLRLLTHELTHVVQQGSAGLGVSGRAGLPAVALRTPAGAPEQPVLIQRQSLATAFSNYRGACDCGEDLGNNCAHYLSDALIRAGYTELDGGTGALYRRRNGRVVCKAGRPVRARELRDWFAGQASATHSGEPTDDSRYWAVYQERAADGQGHVLIHHHTGTGTAYDWRGTGDYPS
jgi:hypothetical protein